MKTNHIIIYFVSVVFSAVTISVLLSSSKPIETTIVDPVVSIDSIVDTDVYAGRTEEEDSCTYNSLALPKSRYWLSAKEWKGEHISKMDISLKEKRILKTRFKTWKTLHIAEFINYMGAAAQEEHKHFPDIPPSLYISQSLIESNFGISRLAIQAKNMYGHKWTKKDKKYLVCADDSPTDKFDMFLSEWHSLRSHSYLLMRKYRKRIKGNPSLDKWLAALCGAMTTAGSKAYVDAGGSVYATSCFKDVCYAQKLKRIINHYNLRRFD
mgnify:FL=1